VAQILDDTGEAEEKPIYPRVVVLDVSERTLFLFVIHEELNVSASRNALRCEQFRILNAATDYQLDENEFFR
jgi:hypothetical protein